MNAAMQKGLGKGLSALMGEDYSQSVPTPSPASATSVAGPQRLRLDLIHSGKFQPRLRFDEEYLNELADSIEKNGVMQPIIIRPSLEQAGKFEIIAGERRWRASKLAKVADIPVIIRDIDDKLALELALVENIQRQDLRPLEEAAGFQRLTDEFGYTQEELARTVGKSRSHIANLLRLLTLPDEIKKYMDSDELTMGHARALLNSEKPVELAREVVKRGLNVRQTENLARSGGISELQSGKSRSNGNNSSSTRQHRDKDPDILALEETLSENLGIGVSIYDQGGQKGEIVLRYNSLTQLDDILRRLGDSI